MLLLTELAVKDGNSDNRLVEEDEVSVSIIHDCEFNGSVRTRRCMTLHGGEPFDISTSSLADYFFSESIADENHTFLTTKGRYFITLTFIFYAFQHIALLLK